MYQVLRFLSNHNSLNSNGKILFCLKKKAFTLIELLAVIAIIALLISILLPALNLVKRKAAGAVCLCNVKNLALAWYMYQDENNGYMVEANPGDNGWIQNPQLADGTECDAEQASPPVTDEDEIRGIEKGLLYSYLESFDVFHCPADNQRRSKYDFSKIFRTYSIPNCLRRGFITKFSDIRSPSRCYNFVEESEGRNFNVGTWSFMTPALLGPGNWEWQDPIGVNHGDSGVLGFCDGHAEVHKWRDPHTTLRVEYYFNHKEIYGYGTLNEVYPRPANQVTDIQYMARGWAHL